MCRDLPGSNESYESWQLAVPRSTVRGTGRDDPSSRTGAARCRTGDAASARVDEQPIGTVLMTSAIARYSGTEQRPMCGTRGVSGASAFGPTRAALDPCGWSS